jgi:hypothetical protein
VYNEYYAYHFPIATRTNLVLTNILIYHLVSIFILEKIVKITIQIRTDM